jgi:hypothetical protein
MAAARSRRSTLPKHEARQRYVAIGELVALEQIRKDCNLLDRKSIPIGPFARLDAGAVAARDGKTRGAITNLFGSQAAFQTEMMELALNSGDWIDRIEYPDPGAYPTADEWLAAFLAGESARGPRHGSKPVVDYGFLWALWLGFMPYGLWSERVARPSMDEHVQWLGRLEEVLSRAVERFDLTLREGTTINDLACGLASLIEGVWLNQCLTARHPTDPAEPIETVLLRSARLLWLGATQPRP